MRFEFLLFAGRETLCRDLQFIFLHRNVEEALEPIGDLLLDLDWDLIHKLSAPARKLSAGIADFETHRRALKANKQPSPFRTAQLFVQDGSYLVRSDTDTALRKFT